MQVFASVRLRTLVDVTVLVIAADSSKRNGSLHKRNAQTGGGFVSEIIMTSTRC